MSTYKVVNAFHSVTGNPKDDVVNTYWYQTSEGANVPATALALAGHVAASWETITAPGTAKPSTWISPEISRVTKPTLKVYGAAGGSPIAQTDWLAMSAAAFDQGMPGEVAMCLSYNGVLTDIPEETPDDAFDADSNIERPASRRRGRIYVGPLILTCASAGEPVRPVGTIMDDLLGLGVGLGTPTNPLLTAVGTEWVVHSGNFPDSDGTNHPIIRVTVDDAFDTQRRRGVDSSLRIFANV